MSRATVELDFFGMEKESASQKSQFQKFLDRRRSFREIHNAISKINPDLIRSVIASGTANQIDSQKPISVPSSPDGSQTLLQALPVLNSASQAPYDHLPDTAPLTIFYNGSVAVFNVPRDKAESILKFAVEGCSNKGHSEDPTFPIPCSNDPQLLETLNADLPIARRKSLQRFLEKRKERLTSVSPYLC